MSLVYSINCYFCHFHTFLFISNSQFNVLFSLSFSFLRRSVYGINRDRRPAANRWRSHKNSFRSHAFGAWNYPLCLDDARKHNIEKRHGTPIFTERKKEHATNDCNSRSQIECRVSNDNKVNRFSRAWSASWRPVVTIKFLDDFLSILSSIECGNVRDAQIQKKKRTEKRFHLSHAAQRSISIYCFRLFECKHDNRVSISFLRESEHGFCGFHFFFLFFFPPVNFQSTDSNGIFFSFPFGHCANDVDIICFAQLSNLFSRVKIYSINKSKTERLLRGLRIDQFSFDNFRHEIEKRRKRSHEIIIIITTNVDSVCL